MTLLRALLRIHGKNNSFSKREIFCFKKRHEEKPGWDPLFDSGGSDNKKRVQSRSRLLARKKIDFKKIKTNPINSMQQFITTIKTAMRSTKRSVASGLIFVVMGMTIFAPIAPAFAANFTFTQSTWTGGASSTATAVDPGNRSGWNYYNNASSTINSSGANQISLIASTSSAVQSTSTTGFNGGTFTTTATSSDGSVTLTPLSAQIIVATTTGTSNYPTTLLPNAQGGWNASGSVFATATTSGSSVVLGMVPNLNNAWAQTTAITGGPPAIRGTHSAVWDTQNNTMRVFGGSNSSGSLNDLWSYTPSNNTWAQPTGTIGGPPAARFGHSAIWDASTTMWVFGGGTSTVYYNDLWSYTPSTNTWAQPTGTIGGPPTSRTYHSAVWDTQSNKMWVFGGFSSGNNLNDLWSYTPSTNTWAQPTGTIGGPPAVRANHTAVWDTQSNKMWVFGGLGGSYLNDLWSYTPSTNTWAQPTGTIGGPPVTRFFHSAVWDAQNNRMLVFGGQQNSTKYNDLWSYTPSTNTWAQLSATGAPTARLGHSAVWDTQNNKMRVFGGYSSSNLNDLWASVSPMSYGTSGTYTSYIDGGYNTGATWNKLTWSGTFPSAATTISFNILGTNSATAPSSWTGACTVAATAVSGSVSLSGCGTTGQYLWYQATLSTTNTAQTPTLDSVSATAAVAQGYNTAGTYESATIDLGSAKSLTSLSFNPTAQSGGATLQFQLAVSNASTGPWTYVGSDGTANTYFTSSGQATPAALNGYRYVRYKAWLAGAGIGWQTMPSIPGGTTGSYYPAYDGAGNIRAGGYKYNIASGTWSAGSVAVSRSSTIYNGKLYAGSGGTSAGVLTIYDLATGAVLGTSAEPYAMPSSVGYALTNKGGSIVWASQASGGYNRAFIYDISTGTWSTTANMSAYTNGVTSVAFGAGSIIYMENKYGGYSAYDIKAGVLAPITSPGIVSQYAYDALAYDNNGKLYIGNLATTTFKYYDVNADAQVILASAPYTFMGIAYDNAGNIWGVSDTPVSGSTPFFRYSTRANAPAQFSNVTINYSGYSKGSLISSPYNAGDPTNAIGSLQWLASTPGSTDIKFQMRTAASSAALASAPWVGPDGLSTSYFLNSNQAITGSNFASNAQWFQYQVFLNSSDGINTPTLQNATTTYVINAAPQFDSTYGTNGVTVSQSTTTGVTWGKVLVSYKVKDIDTTADAGSINAIKPSFEYSTNGGSTWASIASSALGASDLNALTVSTSAFATGSATWNAASTLGSAYNANVMLRVSANDGQLANGTTTATTAVIAVDTLAPTNKGMAFDAGIAGQVNTGSVTINNPSDNNAIQYLLSDGTSTVGWTNIAATTTIPWTFDSAINAKSLKLQLRDSYGNTTASTTYSTAIPPDPNGFVIQDVSKIATGDYRLYIGWATSSDPNFASYKLEYATSTDNTTFSSYSDAAVISTVANNYYVHTGLNTNWYYRYRLGIINTANNISVRANTYINARPDGVQNLGEGGGGSVATAAAITAVSPVQTKSAGTVTVSYSLTDTSITSKTNPSYEGYVFYNIGTTITTSDALTITVSDASHLPQSGYIQINNEVIGYTSKTGNVLNGITRGTWPTASTTRATRQNALLLSNTPVWVQASSTKTIIANVSISTGQSGTIIWNTQNEPALAGATYSNVGIRVLVHDNQSATAGPITTQSDQSNDGTLSSLDMSAPTVAFIASSASTPESAASSTVMTIALSKIYPLATSIQYSIDPSSTGVSGVDYLMASTTGTVTIAAGATSTTLAIQPLSDHVFGSNKTAVIKLSSPVNATMGTNSTYTLIITEADTQPTIQFATSSAAGAETTPSYSIPVLLSATSTTQTTVSYAVSTSTAVSGVDYTLTAGTVTIAAGSTTASIPLSIIHDNLFGSNKTVTVTLSTPSGAVLGTTTSFVYTIQESDLTPQASFASASASVAETAGTTTVNVILSYPSNVDLTIPVAVASSTAVSGVDYTAPSSITIPAGATSSPLSIVALHNPSYGADVAVNLALGTVAGMTLGASTTFTLAITETDNAAPQVSSVSASQIVDPADLNFGKLSISYGLRDANTTSGRVNPGYVTPSIQYNIGSGWVNIASNALSTGALDNEAVAELATTTYSAIWNARASLGAVSLSGIQLRVTANDNESINNIGQGTSTPFSLDTQSPVASAFHYDGRTGLLTVNLSDANTYSYAISNNADLTPDLANASTSGMWTQASASTSLSIPWNMSVASTTYSSITLGVKDVFGNAATTTVYIPNATINFAFHDTSDVASGAYKELLTWKSYSATSSAPFASYDLYRSTNGTTFSLLTSINAITTNYYVDDNLASSTTYYYKMTVTDTSGDTSPYSSTVNDIPDGFGSTRLTPPVITGVSAANVHNVSATINWTTDEQANSTVKWSTDTSYSNSTTSATLVTDHSQVITGLTPNTVYLFRVQSTDVSANTADISSASGTAFTFTTTGGAIVTQVQASTTINTATVTWHTNKDSDSVVLYSPSSNFNGSYQVPGVTTPVGEASTTNDFLHTVTITGLQSAASYWYKVQSSDSVGNVTTDDNSGFYYVMNTLADTFPPVISNITEPIITSQGAVIFWQTDKLATSQVLYGVDPSSLLSDTGVDQVPTVYHSMTISKLTQDTPYYFQIKTMGGNHIEARSTTTSFTTTKEGEVKIVTVGGGGAGQNNNPAAEVKDTTPPVISSITIASTTPFGATITYTTDKPALDFVEYGKTTEYSGTVGHDDYDTMHEMHIDGLAIGATYHFRVQVRDKAGNTTLSEDQTFKTKYLSESASDLKTITDITAYEQVSGEAVESILPSIRPPFVEEPHITNVTENTADIQWKTNIKSYAVILYAKESEFDATKANPYTAEVSHTDMKDTDHHLTLVGLDPNTKYHFMVRSFSLPQVVGSSQDMTFITKASKVQARVINVKNSSFDVVWTTEDAASTIVEYKNVKTGAIERRIDNEKKKEHDMLVDKLLPAVTYEVTVFGYNEKGNLIEGGAPSTVTTIRDVTAPKIANFKVDGALVPGRTDRVQTVVTWSTDESSNSTVYYQEGAGKVEKEFANKVEQLDTYTNSHAVILSNLKPGTIYQMKIESLDAAGNKASFGPRTIITPQKGESIFDVIFKNFEDTFKFLRSAGQ